MRILYLGPPGSLEIVRSHLSANTEVTLALNEEAVDRELENCDAVLDAYMRIKFDADRLARAKRLDLFVTATTGADHVDAEVLAARGIPLLTLRGEREVLRNITAAAEHSWLLLMACARSLIPAVEAVRSGDWNRNRFPGVMLRGRTLGLIGCGRIGGWMSRYAIAFGMTCVGYDPFAEHFAEGVHPVDLDELLIRSDFVSVHVPLNDDTRLLLGAEEIQKMKHGAILINTSRGEILDETALLVALLEGRLASAGLDVLTGEPQTAENPLVQYARNHANLLITPHIGGFSPDALAHVLEFCCGRIRNHFSD